jgi:hypothetical protein
MVLRAARWDGELRRATLLDEKGAAKSAYF